MNNEEKAEILKSTEKLWNERNRLKELEKENERLKKDCSIWECRAKGLLHKNEMVDVYSLQKENAELKAQNEKMKNFYNCAHSSRALCPNEHKCKGCKDWELTE